MGLALVGTVAALVAAVVRLVADDGEAGPEGSLLAAPPSTADPGSEGSALPFRTTFAGLADPSGFGRPYPNAKVRGLLTFRGNPSRSYYGSGPLPTRPVERYRFPEAAMCRSSSNLGRTKVWCGMGWTGQVTLAERDGPGPARTWAVFGGYDGHLHFMDAATGQRILPDLVTGDLIKGTPTIDPDGFPLVYSGSRDDLLRVVAIDRPGRAEVLWTLDSESVGPVLWNDDWDSSPLVLGDHLIVGSESSRFWVIELNRRIGPDGLVQVDPEVTYTTEAWDAEVLAADGDEVASVESSVAVYRDTVYFGTSAGLILGFDLSDIDSPRRVFRLWTGGDNDASVVVDPDGFLYVGSQYDRDLPRAREVGQLTKLDPSRPDDPVVWKVDDSAALEGGVYGTPAVVGQMVYVGTNGGRLMGVDRSDGTVRWTKFMGGPVWGSPVVVDDTLLVGDCNGVLHAYDVSDPGADPPQRWSVTLGGCIEATPAVWDGQIFLGTRAGYLHVLGEPDAGAAGVDSER